jgi:L-ascorbate metabolism protein UlaG (beta-lactamase superfamily)
VKITKYVHSCLLVETENRTALFDPGVYSESAFDITELESLDDIFITHEHADHFSMSLVKELFAAFPDVQITSTAPVVAALAKENISAYITPQAGVKLFDAPHETMYPLGPKEATANIGVHYMDMISHPGDSHSFNETMRILALPVTGPWGRSNDAAALALALKPQFVIPVHDWHLNDGARDWMYERFESLLAEQGITFLKPETGKALTISL